MANNFNNKMNNKPPLRKPPKGFPPKNRTPQPNGGGFLIWLLIGSMVLMFLAQKDTVNTMSPTKELTYSEFYSILKDNDTTGRIERIELIESPESILKGTFSDGSEFRLHFPQNDEEIFKEIRAKVKNFSVKPAQTFWPQLLANLIPFLIFILILWFISYRGSQMGNKIWSFGKSKARVNNKNDQNVTFNDVAGVDEAKEELQEIIEFLKEPRKFQRLGGKIPKGVLLVGQPGTGKTLLAKAVAGEAGVPFFSLSGSDFVEMFVGVGASRVRDLFDQARKASKTMGKGSIVFIDEIDAVGRLRFAGIGGGNDEREQTLNALLVEMDGFNTGTGIIVVAATNRPDTLDPALLRPGRFDRQIVVGLPDIQGREEILKVHTRNIKLDKDVNFKKIAMQTVYFSGADLANVCNEAALLAARKDKDTVGMEDMLAAVERVTMGPEKKSRTISRREKEMTAYHEAGHALLSLLIEEVDTFTKVSIIPRGMAGGYTLTPPTEDKHYLTKKELLGTMTVLLGGLVAEELFMNDTTTGVSNDLQKVAQLARAMICDYGMNDELGTMAFGNHEKQHFLGRDLWDQKDFSEETAKKIDQEVKNLVDNAYTRARKLLTENRDKLDLIARHLIEKEVIDIEQTRVLLGMAEPASQDGDRVSVPLPEHSPSAQNPKLSQSSENDKKPLR